MDFIRRSKPKQHETLETKMATNVDDGGGDDGNDFDDGDDRDYVDDVDDMDMICILI